MGKNKNNENCPFVVAFPFDFSNLAFYSSLCIFGAAVTPWHRQVTGVGPYFLKNENYAASPLFQPMEQLFKMEAALPILSLYV